MGIFSVGTQNKQTNEKQLKRVEQKQADNKVKESDASQKIVRFEALMILLGPISRFCLFRVGSISSPRRGPPATSDSHCLVFEPVEQWIGLPVG